MRQRLIFVLLACAITCVSAPAQGGIAAFDTMQPFGDGVDLEDRAAWSLIDPGIDEGYSCEGDLVLENEHFTAVMWSSAGRVVLYSRADPSAKRLELVPLELGARPGAKLSCQMARLAADEAVVGCGFSGSDLPDGCDATFSFTGGEIVEVESEGSMRGLSLQARLSYAVVPNVISDDLIYRADAYPELRALHIPSENMLLGLVEGRDSALVTAWGQGQQTARLTLESEDGAGRLIESIDIATDGQPVFVALLEAPGIWHAEEFTPSYLERDTASEWQKPFGGKWLTQLVEDRVATTYTFGTAAEHATKNPWRAGIGNYRYPVWFDEDTAVYRMGKKMPPVGVSVVYCTERTSETPESVLCPYDVVGRVLDEPTRAGVLDFAGRTERPPYRLDYVVGCATCGVTRELTPVFEEGKEVDERARVEGGIEDMLAHLRVLHGRTSDYREWAGVMVRYLADQKADDPETKAYLDEITPMAEALIDAYDASKENIQDMDAAQALGRLTAALTAKHRPSNLKRFTGLGADWRRMGGGLESLVRKQNTLARRIFQEAGYRGVSSPEMAELAEEIRRRTRDILR
ncbi:MAG TPA: hypothetical protein QGH10_23790, partial [Armatimonadota bacterium]|nr:hypothetical protein [Armatimonadota bacterium]